MEAGDHAKNPNATQGRSCPLIPKESLRVAELRRNSLDIVDAARPILRAITHTPRP